MLHITNEHPTVLETTTIHLLSELLIARRIIEILISTPVKAILSYHETRYVTWKKKQTNKQENKNSAATEDCACFHSTLKADPFLALCPGFSQLSTLFMLQSTNWCMELLAVVDMPKASCFPNSKLKFPL